MDHEMIPFSFFILSCSDLKKKITTSLRTIDAFRKKQVQTCTELLCSVGCSRRNCEICAKKSRGLSIGTYVHRDAAAAVHRVGVIS